MEVCMNARLIRIRNAAAGLAVGSFSFGAFAGSPAAFVHDGQAGFVVSHFQYALGKDAKDTGACPNGMTKGIQYEDPVSKSGAKESEEETRRRFFANIMGPDSKDYCRNPEAGGPDPNFRTITGPNVPAYGIDLDGQDATMKRKPAPGTCAHDDFKGMEGEHGVDNQFFRAVGCSNSFQSTGQSNTFEIEMLTGSWGILITLSGVDDIRNDADVEVGIYANADPIELSPNREPLPNATYAIEQNPRFQSKTRGRIVNGVLTTDPVDVRIHWVVNSIYLERSLRDARARLTINPDGSMEGILAGYSSVDELYDFQYAFRNGKNAKGEPADLRLRVVSSIGQAAVLGHTCNGAYYALHELADGNPDPKTGKCTSISTQYQLKAIPAFVVNTKTKGANDDLEGK
jgi:hypothetical protein